MTTLIDCNDTRKAISYKQQDASFQRAMRIAYPHFKDPQITPLNVPDPHLMDILQATSHVSGLPLNVILSKSRVWELVMWRHACIFVMLEATDYPVSRIARYMSLHHTSAISACNNVSSDTERFGYAVRSICARLGANPPAPYHG